MKQKHWSIVIGSVILTLGTFVGVGVAQADTIDTSSTASWGVDRYAPSSFVSTTVAGNQALQSTISSADSLNNRPSAYNAAFYNTQGEKTTVNSGNTLGSWSLSGDLYVSSSMLSGSAGPMSQELWAGTGNNGGYYIMGLLSGAATRSYGAAGSASSQLEVWNDLLGTWTYLSTSGMTAGWNSLDIVSDGVGLVNYIVNGVTVFSQTDMGGVLGDPSINDLSTVYLENYNFYGGTPTPNVQTGISYTSAWSNLAYSVSDRSSTAGLMLASIGLLVFIGKKHLLPTV